MQALTILADSSGDYNIRRQTGHDKNHQEGCPTPFNDLFLMTLSIWAQQQLLLSLPLYPKDSAYLVSYAPPK